MTGPTRDGNGRFDRDPETAKRDAEACRLRAQNLTYRQIAADLGADVHTAYDAVQRALRDTMQEPADDVRRLALMRLDEYARHAREVLTIRITSCLKAGWCGSAYRPTSSASPA